MKFKHGPYSPSRLDTGTCGYAFYKQYIDPERSKLKKEGLAQARGSAVHEVFERVTKKMLEDPNYVFSEVEIRNWIVECINAHPAAYEEVESIVEMVKLYIRKPPAVLTSDAGIELRLAIKPVFNPDGSWQSYEDTMTVTHPNGEQGVITVTRPKFVECSYDDPEAIARGRADIMLISDDTTTAIVYDHKTQPHVEEADTFQMGFYAWVISRVYPFLNEIQTVLHFARYGKYSEPYVWRPQDLLQIEDMFLTRASIIEGKQSWEATPHKNCQYCPLLATCPAMQEFITVDENGGFAVRGDNLAILGDAHKAAKIAGLINVIENVLKSAKGELREFVKKVGPVAIPGRIYEFRAEEGINWDKVNKIRGEVFDVFDKYGVDPKQYMSFNQTASKHIWMSENEALVKDLAEVFPRKVSTTFEGYKG